MMDAPNPSSCASFFGRRKNLGSHTQVDTVVEFVVPDFARSTGFALDAILAGLVVGQRFRAGGNARFADFHHLVNGFVVFVGLKNSDKKDIIVE